MPLLLPTQRPLILPGQDSLFDRLVAYWPNDEADPAALRRDISRNGNDLTTSGSPVTVAGPSTAVPRATTYNLASSQFANLAKTASLASGDIALTVAILVYPTDISGSPFPVGRWTTAGAQREWNIRINSDGSVSFFVTHDGVTAVSVALAAGTVTINNWSLLLARHDPVANTITLQHNNGTPASTAHTLGIYNGSGSTTVGGLGGAASFTGRIGPVGIWKRVLAASDGTRLYNNGAFFRLVG